jgi:putative endonuclease
VTNDLERRLFEHKQKLADGFTKQYRIDRLVYYEETPNVLAAIEREKQIKGWLRERKIALIESQNLTWEDLGEAWYRDFSKADFSSRSS